MRRLLLAAATALALLVPTAGATAATSSGTRLHDARYCEILEVRGSLPNVTATVWNTIGLNECPDADWRAFDATQLAQELGATAVVLNGPRHFLMDAASATTGEVRSFHGMKMRKVATIPIRTAGELVQTAYTDRTIARNNNWSWKKGRRVFELVAPGGDTYVMQSYSQIRDPNLTLAQLPKLGKRLKLPAGWRYRSRTLKRPLDLVARGKATVLQDELQNTYQLATTPRLPAKRTRHSVSIKGVTKTVASTAQGTVEDRGTLTGKPFGKGSIVLLGTLAQGKLTATFRLLFPDGSVLGTATAPFTIDGSGIDFVGTARFTGGTGAYRGITSGALPLHDHNTLDGQNGTLTVKGDAKY